MALPTDRTTFIDHCKQELGEPVIVVNLAQVQLNNSVDRALQFWREYHEGSQERTYLAIQLTQPMIDSKSITLPSNVMSVQKVIDPNTFGGSSIGGESLFDYDFQFMQANVWDMASFGGAVGYYISRQYLADMDFLLSPAPPFRYRQHNGVLHIDTTLSSLLNVGQYVVVECYAWLDEVGNASIWSDRYFAKLATAYMKKNWGEVLKKYGGVTLPSGIQLDGQSIFNEAVQDIEEAETQIRNHMEPLGIVIA